MSPLDILPFILFLVVIITAVADRINIPYPLLLVITGLLIGITPHPIIWHPDHDSVLSVFLPPILFSAARLTNWHDIRQYRLTIFNLSLLLVLLTVISTALILNHFLSTINFSAALVLGAIIAPTDTVAACAILQRMNVQKNLIKTVEIESLFNDAAGIVLFNIALYYVYSDSISAAILSTHALWVGCGGIAIGLLLAFLSGTITEYFLLDSNSPLPIIMSLILAYVAYLLADKVNASGVLSVVAAGIYQQKTEIKIAARTRLTETSVWDTLIFFLNGLIFITIGIQFPHYLKIMSHFPTMQLVYASLVTILTIVCLRFFWVLLTNWLENILSNEKKRLSSKEMVMKVVIISWSGMRGLVSMALAISLPTMISNTTFFPDRELIIFLTFSTILFTLIVQGLTLPWVIKWTGAGKDQLEEQNLSNSIHERLTQKAIKKMKQNWEDNPHLSHDARHVVEHYYRHRENSIELTSNTHKEALAILADILNYERDFLLKLRKRGEISDEIYMKLLQRMDRDEVGFESFS